MSWRALGVLSFMVLVGVLPTMTSYAAPPFEPGLAGSPLDLVNAVNGLRSAYGLPPYSLNPILMSTAQAQADFLAVTQSMSHAGPGGIGLTDRLLAAGYPLAGDLSLGGFRSENITGGPEEMPAEAAVKRWTGDALHLNTMISPDLTEIGAGVAINNGRVYYVIDAARPTAGSLTPAGAGTPVTVASPPGVVYPVSVSTPNAEGSVVHEVKQGQSLWLIAIAYEVKIDEIKSLNNLLDTGIFPGQRLLIKPGVAVTVIPPTATPKPPVLMTITSHPTHAMPPQGATAETPPGNTGGMQIAVGIIALAALVGGIVAWLGSRKQGNIR